MTQLSLDQVALVVNSIAKKEAMRRGLADDMLLVQLVPGLNADMIVDMNKGPTVMIQLAWPENAAAPLLLAQIRSAILLILKHSRREYAMIPLSFVQKEEERAGKRRKAWKRGNVWEDIEDRVPSLIPRERVQVEFRSTTIYRDVMTGTEVESRRSYKKMHTKDDQIGPWLELSLLVHEQHPESFEEDIEDEIAIPPSTDSTENDESSDSSASHEGRNGDSEPNSSSRTGIESQESERVVDGGEEN